MSLERKKISFYDPNLVLWLWQVIFNIKIVFSLILSVVLLLYFTQNRAMRQVRNFFIILIHISFTGYYFSIHILYFTITTLEEVNREIFLITNIIPIYFILLTNIGLLFTLLIDSKYFQKQSIVISTFLSVILLFLLVQSTYLFFDYSNTSNQTSRNLSNIGIYIIFTFTILLSISLILACLYSPWKIRIFPEYKKYMFFCGNYRSYGLAMLLLVVGMFAELGSAESILFNSSLMVIITIINIIVIFGLCFMLISFYETHARLKDEKVLSIIQTEEILRKITETSVDYIMMLDLNCQIQFINKEEKGLRKEDIIGTPLYNLVDPGDRKRIEDILRSVITQKKPINYETNYKHPDGTKINYESSAVPMESDGKVIGIIVNSRDVTKRKKTELTLTKARDDLTEKMEIATRSLREGKKRIEAVVETIPDGIVVFDTEGKIYIVNKVFREIYEKIYNKELPTKLDDFLVIGHPFGETIAKLFYKEVIDTITIEPQSGFHLQLASSQVMINPNTHHGIVVSVRDVTPFIEIDQLRRQFVSMVSHELRTPITSINLSINNLKKFQRKLSEKQKEEIIEMIAESSYVLNQMIEDLLLVSRIDEGRFQLQLEICKLRELLDKTIAQLKPRCDQKNINIQVNCNPTIEIFSDPKRLIQIFRIILDNAIKYSPTNTQITVEGFKNYKGEYNMSDTSGYLIQISDEGIGIDEKDIPHIFDRFYRTRKVKDIQGTGLGLSIAKELVELHKGHIFVKSELDKGSTFSVFIPHQKFIEDNIINLISKVIGKNYR